MWWPGNFSRLDGSFELGKLGYERVGENNEKDGKAELYFQKLKEKLACRYFLAWAMKRAIERASGCGKFFRCFYGILFKSSAKKAYTYGICRPAFLFWRHPGPHSPFHPPPAAVFDPTENISFSDDQNSLESIFFFFFDYQPYHDLVWIPSCKEKTKMADPDMVNDRWSR